MEIINLSSEELIEVINNHIKNNYDYDYANIFDDAIVINLNDGKKVYINVEVDTGEIDD